MRAAAQGIRVHTDVQASTGSDDKEGRLGRRLCWRKRSKGLKVCKLLTAAVALLLWPSGSLTTEAAKTEATMLRCSGTMTVARALPQPTPFTDSLLVDLANMVVSGFTVGRIETVTDRTVDWLRPYPPNPSECETGTIDRVTGQVFAFV